MRGARAGGHVTGGVVLAVTEPARRRRILLYRTLGLGDFLTGVPAYRAVRRAFPDDEVVLAAPAPLRPLAQMSGAVDSLLPTSELAVPRWHSPPPDLAVNLHGTGPASHRALLALRPARLVGFSSAPAGVSGPRWNPYEHEVPRWCRMLADSGIPADPTDLRLEPTGVRLSAVPPSATVLHPGAAHPARRWPADRFAEVARALSDGGHRVVVTGGLDEMELARSVASQAGLPPDRVVAGRLDLAGLSEVVAEARLVVSGDTGVAHLATAFGSPSVVLFGKVSPAQWGPPAEPQHRVLWRAELAGVPLPSDGPHPALAALTVSEVLDAVWSLDGSTSALSRS